MDEDSAFTAAQLASLEEIEKTDRVAKWLEARQSVKTAPAFWDAWKSKEAGQALLTTFLTLLVSLLTGTAAYFANMKANQKAENLAAQSEQHAERAEKRADEAQRMANVDEVIKLTTLGFSSPANYENVRRVLGSIAANDPNSNSFEHLALIALTEGQPADPNKHPPTIGEPASPGRTFHGTSVSQAVAIAKGTLPRNIYIQDYGDADGVGGAASARTALVNAYVPVAGIENVCRTHSYINPRYFLRSAIGVYYHHPADEPGAQYTANAIQGALPGSPIKLYDLSTRPGASKVGNGVIEVWFPAPATMAACTQPGN